MSHASLNVGTCLLEDGPDSGPGQGTDVGTGLGLEFRAGFPTPG
jgi:hypothetical protein